MKIRGSLLLTLFVFALVTRLAFVATRDNELAFPDSRDYDSIARNLLRGEGFHEASAAPAAPNAATAGAGGRRASRAPGYPIFLAACYWVGFESPRAIYLVQAFVSAAACVLIALLGRRLYDNTVGLLSGCLAAIDPFFVFFTGLLLAETLFILGFVAFILMAAQLQDVSMSRNRFIRVAVTMGIVAGLLTHLRSSFILFPFFVLPFLLLRSRERLKTTAAWCLMALAIAAILSPWVVRNYRLFGRVIPTTLQVGESLYEANSPYADGGPAMDRIDWVAERGGVSMSEFDNNEYFKRAALKYIKDHPGRTIVLGLEKFRRFWNIIPNFEEYRKPSYIMISLCAYVPLILLALLDLIFRRGQGRALLTLLPPICYFTAIHIVFVGSIRYRLAVMPFVIILTAAGIQTAWGWFSGRRRQEMTANG